MTKLKSNQKAYDKAFHKMYKDLLAQDLSTRDFNKAYDNWIKANAPKYGISLE